MVLWLTIDKNANLSIIRQVYEGLSNKILRGELKAGEKLPSTRELAIHLNVSRNVILEAYQLLLAEGYIVSIPNSGTFVAEGTLLEAKTAWQPEFPEETSNLLPSNNDHVDFRSGVPALDLLPRKKWCQIAQEILLDSADCLFGYDNASGRKELREAISYYLQKTRGVICHPDQIIITSGSVQSFSLLAKFFLKNNQPFVIEDPLHHDISKIFHSASSAIYPVPVDEFGIQTLLLPSDIMPSFVFVTPSHQYPLGANLPVQRRIELIQYARKKDCYIVEDDYDSEFRYEGLPVSSLQGLDPDRVIYIGSFSKILFPALRLGYMILPWRLVPDFRVIKKMSDHHSHTLEQLTLASFISEHHLERHIAKMKKVYRGRRDYLISCLRKNFGDLVSIEGYSTGLHLIAVFSGFNFDNGAVDKLKQAGVSVYPVGIHYLNLNAPQNKLIMGYSHLTNEQIELGIDRLYQIIYPQL